MTPSKIERQQEIRENVEKIRERIHLACERKGRSLETVRLLLVTKSVPSASVACALDSGADLIGENNEDELADKIKELQTYQPEIHFLGFLSPEKIAFVLDNADFVQTVDRYDIAWEMNKHLHMMEKEMNVLVQVNTSFRKNHPGIIPEHAVRLVLQVARLPFLRVRGLMMSAVPGDTPEKSRAGFRLLKNLSQEISLLNIEEVRMDYLSMGTDRDFDIAIEEGATMVRIGAAVFGKR